MLPRSKPCPCTSGKTYGQCCQPFHGGQADPQDAPTLVRTRYAGFALGEVEYLWKTLHSHNPDRDKGKEQVLVALRLASSSYRFMGMSLIADRPADAEGVSRVLYLARVFQRGREISFVESAEFMHEGGGVRYVGGKSVDVQKIPGEWAKLTFESFAALTRD